MIFQELEIGDWFKFKSTDPYSFKKIGVDKYSYPLILKVSTTVVTIEVIRIDNETTNTDRTN